MSQAIQPYISAPQQPAEGKKVHPLMYALGDRLCACCCSVHLGYVSCELYPDGIPEKHLGIKASEEPSENDCKDFSPFYVKRVNEIISELKKPVWPSIYRKEVLDSIFNIMEPDIFFMVFLDINQTLSDREYWQLLGEHYNRAHPLGKDHKKRKAIFASQRKYRKHIMDDKERVFLKRLPDTVTIFRAMSVQEYESGDFGISWTLSEKVAAFFKENYPWRGERIIRSIQIPKDKIIAYWNSREEEEVIYVHR